MFPESKENIDIVKNNADFRLIELGDIKGVIHNHSTYSDGLNTLKEMATACQKDMIFCDFGQTVFLHSMPTD